MQLFISFTGNAVYIAANYRTFLPIFLLGGMLLAVLVIYIILFRQLKPYYSIQHKHTQGKANGDLIELVTSKETSDSETEVTSL